MGNININYVSACSGDWIFYLPYHNFSVWTSGFNSIRRYLQKPDHTSPGLCAAASPQWLMAPLRQYRPECSPDKKAGNKPRRN